MAIAETLAEKRPLGGRENAFLRLFADARAADPAAFTEVWLEPVACYWTIVAYQLLGGCFSSVSLPPLAEDYRAESGTLDPAAALAVHLSEFGRLALAIALVGGRELTLPEPLHTTLPVAIPATRWSLAGSGPITVFGIERGRILVRHRGRDLSVPLVAEKNDGGDELVDWCPVARAGDFSLRLQPDALRFPGLGLSRMLAGLDPVYQARYAPRVSEALALIARHHPAAFEHVRRVVRVAALKPQKFGDVTNSSHSDLPGAFVLSIVDEPYTLADSIIHEFFHNRLFFIEDEGALFAESEYTLTGTGEHYSPWRPDPRPAQGIFHGLYVYAAVARFWVAVVRSGETSGLLREYAVDQLVRTVLQCEIAAFQLERRAKLTTRGSRLFRELREEVAALRADVACLDLPANPPAVVCWESGELSYRGRPATAIGVRDDVRDHLRRASPAATTADLEAVLDRL